MSLESRVVNKITSKVSEELEKGFNKKEDLDTYTKRTLHGKLAKKLAIKKLKSGNNNELPEEPYKVGGREDLLNIVERKSEKQELNDSQSKPKEYISDFAFMLILTVFVLLFGILGVIGIGYTYTSILVPILTILLLWGIYIYSQKGDKELESISKRALTNEEQLILKYNRVYEISNKYFRYYEICGYDYFEDYIKEGKLKEVGLSIPDTEVSKVLTYNEILAFKEMNNISEDNSEE